MNKTILVVEDEARIRDLIIDYLQHAKYTVLAAEDGVTALEIFNHRAVDLIILDVMMPKLDGLSVCRNIRAADPSVLIIMLTARSEEYDKLLGYEFGADDYLTKPFSAKVLVAKINALLRRTTNTPATGAGVFDLGKLVINELSRTATLHGERVEFTPKEFDLILYLVRNQNIVLSRETILHKVWGYDFYGDLRTVDTHIKRIRRKLQQEADIICTVRGSGYKIEVQN